MEDLRPKCSVYGCEKKATINFQEVWIEWKCKKDGRYSKRFKYRGMDIEEPTGEDNRHFCDEHAELFEDGEDI